MNQVLSVAVQETTEDNQTQQAAIALNLPPARLRACCPVTGGTNSCYLPVCDSGANATSFESSAGEFLIPRESLLLRLGLVMSQLSQVQ